LSHCTMHVGSSFLCIILVMYFFNHSRVRAALINEVECRAPASTERQIASRGSGRILYTAAQSAF
jgi:hypothetical protein